MTSLRLTILGATPQQIERARAAAQAVLDAAGVDAIAAHRAALEREATGDASGLPVSVLEAATAWDLARSAALEAAGRPQRMQGGFQMEAVGSLH